MKIRQLVLASAAVGLAALFIVPAQTDAFDTLGGSLSTSQRHVRVFDNFTDATANDNVTPEPNFPGYTGVELAIWKGVMDWASVLHGGTGNGDPQQVGSLGSGGANFDPVWQGNATIVGNTNSNTASELNATDTGTLAFCETPISDGWRIRFYANWNWSDGPNVGPGKDVQGIMTHEYGHALGLDHTASTTATMFPSASGTGVSARSIDADDIAGVQFIYGVMSTTKPRITGIENDGGQLVVHGFGFGTASNELWFTPNTAGGSGVPVKVLGLVSTANGSRIAAAIPGTAGPGDVFVKLSSSGHASLSNGWPFDPADFPAAPGAAYCFGDGSLATPCPCAAPDTIPSPSGGADSGCANSFNLNGARLDAAGVKNPDQVFLTASGLTPTGFMFFISGTASDPNGVANGDGVRCAAGSFVRFGSQNAVNGAAVYPNPSLGFTLPLSTVSSVTPGGGDSRFYQSFYRNVAASWCNPATTNMSSAYQVIWN